MGRPEVAMARYPSTVMVSIVCPWDDDEQLDEVVFRRATRHALASGFHHVYVFGTAGEGYAVDTARFRQVVEVFRDEATGADEARPMVGVIGLSTANVVERLRVAHDLGIRAFQISLPSWSPVTDGEVVAWFEAVCGSFPDSVFMHYNTVKSGRLVGGSLYRQVVERVPNLVATKTMTSDLGVVASVVRDAPELMHFLTEQSIAYGGLFGQVALLGTFAALAPEQSWALFESVRNGRHAQAAEIGSWFERLHHTIFDPLMVDRRVDGAYDKTIERLSKGMADFPLRMLSPYRTISELEFEAARGRLAATFPELV
jgi:dihydrodipicolinate synthase/N-acetylneuraminate lyase